MRCKWKQRGGGDAVALGEQLVMMERADSRKVFVPLIDVGIARW